MIEGLLCAVAVLGFAPLLSGVIARTKARFAGRRGPPLVQPYRDVLRLLRKGAVQSRSTTWLFRAGPVVGLACALTAALLLPLAGPSPLAFAGDAVLFAYLFGLARFFTIAAALDTGSSFEGMGGARDAWLASLAEPALFAALVVLVRASGSASLSGMLGDGLRDVGGVHGAAFALVAVSLFVVVLAENCRIPFDDPNTHLELTMIHEVMVLDHSGPAFGLVLLGQAVKLFVYGALLVRLAVPATGAPLVDAATLAAGSLALAVGIGAIESSMARLRLLQLPSLLVGATLLSAFGVLLLVV